MPALTGVGEQSVQLSDSGQLRVYWSEVANPETLLEGASRKTAEGKYRQVLREVVGVETAIALPFPAVIANVEALGAVLEEDRERYTEALHRLSDMVQYELMATWAGEERADLATPVKGIEYLKRRQQSEARVAAIDAKLRAVAGGVVSAWLQSPSPSAPGSPGF